MNLPLAVTFIFVSSIFGAFSTLLFKMGSLLRINLKNKKMIGAVLLAGVSFFFYLRALQQAPLTFIYLTASISYIWAIILARLVLHERITKYKIIGISLICLGIISLYVPWS